jgi:hypothetical protein
MLGSHTTAAASVAGERPRVLQRALRGGRLREGTEADGGRRTVRLLHDRPPRLQPRASIHQDGPVALDEHRRAALASVAPARHQRRPSAGVEPLLDDPRLRRGVGAGLRHGREAHRLGGHVDRGPLVVEAAEVGRAAQVEEGRPGAH